MSSIRTPLATSSVPHKSTKRLEVVPSRPEALRQARRIGLIVLALQLALLLAWSGVEAARHAQTGDFSGFYRLWYLISQGHLDPSGGFSAQGIIIEWPLAVLGVIWPHPVTLLVLQDFAIVGSEAVAFLWICDLVEAREGLPVKVYCMTGLALLVLNPWIYWSASWDYHSEPLGTLFAIMAARDLWRGHRIGALWCLLTLLCGIVTAPYVVGVGLSLVLVHRRRTAGFTAIVAGLAWFELLLKLGVGGGVAVAVGAKGPHVSLLSGRFTTALSTLSHFWVDALANVAPSGILGVLTAPAIGISTVVTGENFSQGLVGYVRPSFQGLPLYIFLPVGTILALAWLRRTLGHRVSSALALAAVVNTLGWAIIWIPPVVSTWLRVNPTQSEAITHIEHLIPEQDGVVASQGIAGDFAGRQYANLFAHAPNTYQLVRPYTWFVVAPYAGIETATVAQSVQLIATLARDPRARLMYVNRADIWAFRVRVSSRGPQYLAVGKPTDEYPAGLFATYGRAVRRGHLRSWYMQGNDHARGPILWGDYFLERIGRYRASVVMSGRGLAQAEIWDTTTNRELGSYMLRLRGRPQRATLVAAITRSDPKHSAKALHGLGVFQIDPVKASPGNVLEIRVYAESSSTIKVLRVSLSAIGRPTSS